MDKDILYDKLYSIYDSLVDLDIENLDINETISKYIINIMKKSKDCKFIIIS